MFVDEHQSRRQISKPLVERVSVNDQPKVNVGYKCTHPNLPTMPRLRSAALSLRRSYLTSVSSLFPAVAPTPRW